jgi:uncharacterized protein YcfJ
MKNIVVKSIVSTALLAAAGVTMAQSGPANAFGVVISSTPVVQQVTVPKQICTTTTTQYVQPNGGGALVGALVGGVIGNQIGRGQHSDGRAVATVIGALGGGLVGNQIEANSYPTQSCHTKNVVENRTVAQNVLYEYAGQRYTVQMPAEGTFRVGAQIALHVEAPAYVPAQVQAPVYQPVQTVTYTQPTYVRPQPSYIAAPTVYYTGFDHFAPRYIYSEPYYAPRAVQRPVYRQPVQVVNYHGRPAHPVHPAHPVRHHRDWDEHRNWR